MGTTFAGLCLTPYKVLGINLGDSRVYRIRNNEIVQITKDHNEYQSMIDAGIIMDERTSRRAKHRLTQCLGIPEEKMVLEPYMKVLDAVVKNDIYLLCSDGLFGTLTDERIIKIIAESSSRNESVCEALVKGAEHFGSRDNITVLVVRINEGRTP